MRVVIVSKTKMSANRCVGGLVLDNNQSIRLCSPEGSSSLPAFTHYEIGQLWEMQLSPSPLIEPPHNEDVIIHKKEYLGEQENLGKLLLPRVPIWKGNIFQLYNGCLAFTQTGSGYVSRRMGLPPVSTGYWQSDRPLVCSREEGKFRYRYNSDYTLKYVGLVKPLPTLPAGTLLRVSLARWWRTADAPQAEERCYLQLSGWYQ